MPAARHCSTTFRFLTPGPRRIQDVLACNKAPMFVRRSIVIRFDFNPTKKDSIYWKKQWWTSDNEGTRNIGLAEYGHGT